MSAATWIELPAPAKVNLFLEVLARRSDGYHELDTVMLALELSDRVRARRRDASGVGCSVTGPFASADIPRDERNLAVRGALAALALAQRDGAAGEREGVELELVKQVPSQAGLGAASADAAAAFAAVESLWGWRCDESRACDALAALGSDCVFFRRAATSGLARCTGRGELVEPLPPAPAGLALVVVTPDLGAPTPQVYAQLTNPLWWTDPRRSLPVCFKSATSPPRAWTAELACFNRLEAPACAALPFLRRWQEALRGIGAASFTLSGSGSSFFALCPSRAAAEQLRAEVARALAGAGLHPRGVWVSAPLRTV